MGLYQFLIIAYLFTLIIVIVSYSFTQPIQSTTVGWRNRTVSENIYKSQACFPHVGPK